MRQPQIAISSFKDLRTRETAGFSESNQTHYLVGIKAGLHPDLLQKTVIVHAPEWNLTKLIWQRKRI